jgi:hypothetical protein
MPLKRQKKKKKKREKVCFTSILMSFEIIIKRRLSSARK